MLHLSRAKSLLSAAGFVALLCCLPLYASSSSSKKSSAPPPRPPARSASNGARPGANGARGGSVSHGPTTSGYRTSGVTTGGARTSGGFTTGGARAGESFHAPVAGRGPIAHPGPAGGHDIRVAGGGAIRMRPNGRPADFHDPRRGMDIHHNLAGGRRIAVERADHSRLVFERGRRGYISHPYFYHGHEFARRAYYFHGHYYNRFYMGYAWRGVHLDVYAPWHYYPVGFYGWAYHPWFHPVVYAWGWGPAPWYGYYGAYFVPAPVYPSPALWLSDYTIAESLQASYDAAAADAPPPPLGGDVAPVDPAVRQMVADEVQRQLALENSEAQLNAAGQQPDPNSSSISRMLTDGQPHVFIAGSEVDAVDSSGQECAITDGDVLQLTAAPAPDATAAQLMVMSSKGGADCRKSNVVTVPLDALQEMQNHMRETVDQGLAELQAKQGTGGLPEAPPSAMTAPVTAVATADAPPPDPAGAQELAAQAQQADQSEQELTAQAGPIGGVANTQPPPPQAAPSTVNITPGQSVANVTSALGQPTQILNLGPKTVYVYSSVKITFRAGKVTDIQ